MSPEAGIIDALHQWNLVIHKLAQFRRHPDWKAALDKSVPEFATTLADGRQAIHEKDIEALFESADQKFVDGIIRMTEP